MGFEGGFARSRRRGTPILGWDEQVGGRARSGWPHRGLEWPKRLEPTVNSSQVRVVGERETGEERENYEKK